MQKGAKNTGNKGVWVNIIVGGMETISFLGQGLMFVFCIYKR